ncbi:fimbria/pilus outer membrane usher protein [Henriciella sp.]|uniref:fimbria/pilus outer membrane usher protein n=1 Tax=Henriciella sp. TaxID=1968823 RepID=UPI002617BFE5|nr:fimbria/pilus outer membrane usher protein [Henriciella sp.]
MRVSSLAIATAFLCGPGIAQSSGQSVQTGNTAAAQQSARSITMSVPLVWEGRVLNDVIVQVQPDGTTAIESQSLQAELSQLLTDTGVRRLDDIIGGDPFVSSEDLAAGGFDITFSMSRLELVVNAIDPTLRPVEPLRGRREQRAPLQPSIEPAGFSAYLNTNVNLVHRDQGDSTPPDVFLLGAMRYRNVVLELDGGFTESLDNEYSFYRRSLRAVYDEPDSYRRWSAGDLQLDNTGILQTPFIGGVAVEKSRRTFDPLTARVNLGGRELFIASPSTVEVIINGASYQTLDLRPGTYSLEDLPIQTGSNDVQLVVRDGSGREQVTRFDYFYDPIELRAGEEEYTAAIGAVANELSLQPEYSSDLAFIGHYRKALSDIFILGGGIQASQDLQVVSAETQVVPQVIPGSFDLQGAVSTGDSTGIALRGGYRLVIGSGYGAKRLSASFDYEDENFQSVGNIFRSSFETLSVNASYSQSLTRRTSMVAGANYFSRSRGRDQSTYFLDVNHRLYDNVRATAGVEYGTGSIYESNFGIRVGLSVLFGNRHRGDVTYQSRRELARASLSRGSDNQVGSVGYSVNVQESLGSASVDGVVDYVSNRFEARASLASSGNGLGGITDDQTARLQIGTSLAFADGSFGVGRPIQDSFLLAHPHKTLDGTNVITGRSLRGAGYEASSGILGAAVVNRLSSYNTQDVQYDIDTLEAGYDIGSGVVRVDPPFRSGYELQVGDERFVSAVGFLRIGDAPAELATGIITSQDDEGFEPEPFFTNSAGRFGIIGLAPGRTYTVRLNDTRQAFTIKVPEDNTGLYRLDTINLQAASE